MATLRQAQLLGVRDVDIFHIVPSLRSGTNAAWRTDAYEQTPGTPRGVAYQCTALGTYVPTGDNWVRFTIIQPNISGSDVGPYHFLEGTLIQLWDNQNPSDPNQLNGTGLIGRIVRNSKTNSNDVDAQITYSGGAGAAAYSNTYNYRQLNDVVVRPVTGTEAQWTNVIVSDNALLNMRILSRAAGEINAYQPNYGNELFYRGVTTETVNSASSGTDRYGEGDGQNGAFNWEHDLTATENGGFDFRDWDAIHGRPVTVNDGDPQIDKSNWINDGTPEAPRYTAADRVKVTADATASGQATAEFLSRGGEVDFIGTRFNVNNVANFSTATGQYMSFGREPLALGGTNIAILTTPQNAALTGAWEQSTSGAGPNLRDILQSNALFDIPASELPTNNTLQEVRTRAPVVLTFESEGPNPGQPGNLGNTVRVEIPQGTLLPVLRRSNGNTIVNFSMIDPGNWEQPNASLGVSNISFSEGGVYTFHDCDWDFSRPGRSQTYTSILEFNTTPYINGCRIEMQNTSGASAVRIDGRAGDGYVHNLTINDLRNNAANPQFVLDNSPAQFDRAFEGMGVRTFSIENNASVGATSNVNQQALFIDPIYNIQKPYGPSSSKRGDVNVQRTIRGTVNNGDETLGNLRVQVSQLQRTNIEYTINNDGTIGRRPNPNPAIPRFDELDERVTLTADNPNAPTGNQTHNHEYAIQIPVYDMPALTDTTHYTVNAHNEWRIAFTDFTRLPHVEDRGIGGLGLSTAANFTGAFSPTNFRGGAGPFPEDGIVSREQGSVGDVVLELDPYVTRTRQGMVDLQTYDAATTEGVESLRDLYDAMHGFAVTRTDGELRGLAGEPLTRVNPDDNYLELSFDIDHPITDITATTRLQDAWDPMSADPNLTHGFGPLGYNTNTDAVTLFYRDAPFWATAPSDGANDPQGIRFGASSRNVNALNFSWQIGIDNADIRNIGRTNGGTYSRVSIELQPGESYTFDGATFQGDLSQIIFRCSDASNPASVFFSNITLNGNTGQTLQSIENAAVNVNFPDARNVHFPSLGQAVFTLIDTTGGSRILTDINGNRTHHVTQSQTSMGITFDPAEISGASFAAGETLRVYFKPRDLIATNPFGQTEIIRYLPIVHDFDVRNSPSNATYTIPDSVRQPLSADAEQGMGNVQFDVAAYTRTDPVSGATVPLWSFDGSNPSDGALLSINLHPNTETEGNSEYNLGETKRFAWWWIERHDLQNTGATGGGSGINHWLEVLAQYQARIDYSEPLAGGVPLHVELSQVTVNTIGLLLRIPNPTDPLNTISGLVAADQSGTNNNQVYHVYRSEARDSSGNIPSTSATEKFFYLVEETRMGSGASGSASGIPDIAVVPPQQGLTEFQAQRAANEALQLSQANNILHWVADGQASKIPVGRAYDSTTDYVPEDGG